MALVPQPLPTPPAPIDSSIVEAESRMRLAHQDILAAQKALAVLLAKEEHERTIFNSLCKYRENGPSAPASLPPSAGKRKKSETIPPDTRALIVRKVFLEKSMTWAEAERAFDVSHASIGRIGREEKQHILARYGEGPEPPKKKQRGRHSTYSPEILVFLLTRLEEQSGLTLKQLVTELHEKMNFETTESTLDRNLSRMEITWKAQYDIPEVWNTPQVINARAEFVQNVTIRYHNRPLYFLDEAGFNMHICRKNGRAPVGMKAKVTLSPKGPRISIIGALGPNGIVHYDVQHSMGEVKRGTNGKDFRSFLIELSAKIPRDSVLILDNAKIHKAELLESTWRLLREAKGIECVFLPPYSPFLNPIEYAWNTVKTNVKSKWYKNRLELVESIQTELKAVTSEQALAFFNKSKTYYWHCSQRFPFRGKPLEPTPEEIVQLSSAFTAPAPTAFVYNDPPVPIVHVSHPPSPAASLTLPQSSPLNTQQPEFFPSQDPEATQEDPAMFP